MLASMMIKSPSNAGGGNCQRAKHGEQEASVCNLERGEDGVKRILSIDGGGIRGAQAAAFLAELEKDIDHPVGKYFDLIAGTSTGGILALGFALGKRASDLLNLYERHGPRIFNKSSNKLQRIIGCFRHAIYAKYNADVLRAALRENLGDALIANAQTRLVVPAWNPDLRSPYIYKTAHHERLNTDYRVSMLDAAMATAAAPTYFNRHETADGVGLIDGGVWANNPIAIATVEAITVLGWSPSNLRILSIGFEPSYSLPEKSGFFGIGLNIFDLFADGQSHGALSMAELLTNHRDSKKIYRCPQKTPAGNFALDDISNLNRLKNIGVSCARSMKPDLIRIFFQSTAEKFVPFHNSDGVEA